MAYATLEILADRVRQDLEGHYDGRPAQLAGALGHVLRLLLTAEIPPQLSRLARPRRIRGLRTHLRELARYLQEESRLPEALCARYKYRVGESKVLARYRIGRRAWNYFHDLAAELDWKADLHIPLLRYEGFSWHDELEERFVNLEVVLDSAALEAMLICALEAYLSPRRPRRKGYEVYGINLGMVREVHRRRAHDGVRITRYVSVMRAQPQLSAEAEYGGVTPNPRSLDAILGATTALYPQYQGVGDFHSHPYDNLSVLERKKGWEYTRGDEASNIEIVRAMSEREHRICVSFIVAIARSKQKVAQSHFRGLKNTIQMSLGTCRVILAAYRSLESGRLTKSNIRLRLSGIAG